VSDAAALEVLVPGPPGTLLGPDDDEGLLALFDDPPPRPSTGAHVRGIMIASLDGAATGPDGRSGSLGDDADRRVFGALRALADVVLVGAGTVRAEGYADVQVPDRLRAVRAARGRGERVEMAVVTGRGDVPDAVLDGGALVVTASGAAGLPALRERVGDDRLIIADPVGPARDDVDGPPRVDVTAAVRALAERGLTHVHAEGGPGLLEELLAAGAIDELCLTLAPLLVGSLARRPLVGGSPTWPGRPGTPLTAPTRLTLLHLLRAGDTLLGRWRVP
jgi:riboflavin biosynthesis pyrimidine reductase